MLPTDNQGTGEPPKGAALAPPGIQLRKTLGAAGIMIGSGLIVIMPFVDSLNGIRVSGALSAQDLGILAGFVILLSGMLLYLGSIISHMEHRHRGLEQKIEGLLEASGEEPKAESGKTAAKKSISGSRPDAENEQLVSQVDMAIEAREAGGTAVHPSGPETSPVTPVPTTETASVDAALTAETASVEAAPTAETASVDATPPSETVPSVSVLPAGNTCPVCGNELTGGVCRYCITSASIQSAYQELSRTQELGASVEEAAVLLENARSSLEEKDYLEAGEYVRSSRHFLEISAKTYFALRSAVEKAEAERKKLEDSSLDTTELSSKLSDLRSAIVRGDYQEAKTLLDEERLAASDLRVPYFQRPARATPREELQLQKTPAPVSLNQKPAASEPAAETASAGPAPSVAPAGGLTSPAQATVPKFSSGISACPKCGRKTMKGWKKCPHCLTALK
jgi:hypothetical protein